MKKLIIAAMVFLLVSCGPSFRWVKVGATLDEQGQDERACSFEAEKATASMTGTAAGLQNSIIPYSRVYGSCMEMKGYQKIPIRY